MKTLFEGLTYGGKFELLNGFGYLIVEKEIFVIVLFFALSYFVFEDNFQV